MTNNMDWKKIGYNMGYLRKIAEAKAETPEQEAKETPAHEAAETPAQEAAEHATMEKPQAKGGIPQADLLEASKRFPGQLAAPAAPVAPSPEVQMIIAKMQQYKQAPK